MPYVHYTHTVNAPCLDPVSTPSGHRAGFSLTVHATSHQRGDHIHSAFRFSRVVVSLGDDLFKESVTVFDC